MLGYVGSRGVTVIFCTFASGLHWELVDKATHLDFGYQHVGI